MMQYAILSVAVFVGAMVFFVGCEQSGTAGEKSAARDGAAATQPAVTPTTNPADKVVKTDDEWKKQLTADQFHILREQGTEPAFHNAYFENHDAGKYICAACGLELFSSDTKFESGTGWPSFYEPICTDAVKVGKDADGDRDEVTCPRCGGHLGHVFDDGPKPTGLRYCMNSGAMTFVKK